MATVERPRHAAADDAPEPGFDPALPALARGAHQWRTNVLVVLAETALVALLVITAVVFFASAELRRRSNQESVRDAGVKADLIAKDIIQPLLTHALAEGNDPDAIEALDARTKDLLTRGTVIRIKIWSPEGVVLYSDKTELIGRKFEFDTPASQALHGNKLVASVSDLTDAENEFEAVEGSLLEVYLPVRTPNGDVLVYEDYERFRDVSVGARRVWAVFAPLLLGALLLLELLNFPLVWFLVRRVRQADEQRHELVDRALNAAENERRRLTRDLHDGIVQELIGSSYTVAGVLTRSDPAVDDESRKALGAVASATQRAIRGLRTLLVEVYPPNLETEPLESLLGELLLPLAARGVATSVKVDPGAIESPGSKALVWRTAREAVQNTLAHAAPNQVSITVRQHGPRSAIIQVADDGRGFDPATLPDTPQRGHFGLRLLVDFAREYGGMLTIESTPGSGTTITLVCPR